MRYFDILYKKNMQSIELDAPVVLQQTAIIKDIVDEKILLRNIFANVGTENVVAIAIRGKLADIFGEPVKYDKDEFFEYIYQDIIFEPNTLFGNKVAIELPINARKAEIKIEKIVLQDGTVWNADPNNVVTIQSQREIEASDEFIKSIDNNQIKPVFYAIENQSCWQCTCGQINKVNEEYCRKCNRQKKMVTNMFSKEAIAQEYRNFLQMKENERKEKEEELKKRQLEKKIYEINCENEIEKSKDSFKLQEVEFVTREEKEKKTDNKKKKIIIGCVCGIIVIGLMIGITTIFQKLNTKIPAEITTQSGIASNTNLIQQTKGSIESYVKMIGTVTQDKNVTVAESFLNNIDKVKIMGRKGTVSHGFTAHSGDKIAMMDWKSNDTISVEEYNKFTKSLDEFFGEEAEVQQYDNISDGKCLVWNDMENRCWVIGWYDNNAYLRWYGKDFWNH